MSTEQAELLARILTFDIDGGEVMLPFAARLARENGWSRPYAERVIVEYKRFAFLAITGDAPVCPSEDVDAAWHLHLTYTRSYWKRFCGEVLGRPLHHDPTKGGAAEGEKHSAMYTATLTAYRAAFGQNAPRDIWPAAAERFGDDTRRHVVNTARNWVIPKAPVKRITQLAAVFALTALFVPGCEGGLNPFEMKNTPFLITLGVAMVAAVCVGRVLRSVMRTPNPRPEDDDIKLDWEETAYLAGGTERLTTATVARLVSWGLAKVAKDRKTLTKTGAVPNDVSDVEKAVLNSLPVKNEATALKPVNAAVEAAFATRVARLEEEELMLSTLNKVRIGFTSILPLFLVIFFFALPRLIFGIQANRNVGFLFVEMVGGGLLALTIIGAGSLRLSNRGLAVLEKQKERNASLQKSSRWQSDGDAGMAVALFGTAVLVGTEIAMLQAWYPRQMDGSSSSSGCSTSCGSGCGGGCGGGGD